MTTDAEEGRRQVEAMKLPALKVGDRVRLAAGGQEMEIVALEDYGNKVMCEWGPKQVDVNLWQINRATFPVRSLVRVDQE